MVGRWSFAESERSGRSGGTRRMPVRRSRDAPGRRERLLSYVRRQQYRRLSRAAAAAVASAAAMMLALAVASAGAVSAAGVLLVLALGLGLSARHWLSLAQRSRVGARSEDDARRALAPLQAGGWRLRHSLPWRGRGDIDSLAVAPTGVGFVVETKMRRYGDRHLARVCEQVSAITESSPVLITEIPQGGSA